MIKINRSTILTVFILGLAIYLGTVFAMTFSPSYKLAKDYIESNQQIIETIGPIKHSYIKIFGRSSSRTNEAQYEIRISGEKTASVFLKLQNTEGWKILSATLTSDEGNIIILKEEAK